MKSIIFKSNRIARRNLTLLNTNIFCSYNIVSTLFTNFGLAVEHRKTKVFHFSKSWGNFDSLLLNLISLGNSVFLPKDIWWYFRQYIDFYSNKVIFTIKYMKILSNSNRSLNSLQKRQLYRFCVLSITLYRFQL